MNFKKIKRETARIENFLNGRGWEIGNELQDIIDRAEAEIAQAKEDATMEIIARLERYEQESSTWAAGEMTDLDGETITISKREQQKARTDAKRIQNVIEKICMVE